MIVILSIFVKQIKEVRIYRIVQKSMIRKHKKRLLNISSKAWEHPADRAALAALQQVPMLDSVLRFFLGSTVEESLRLATLASAVRVSERQFPEVHFLLRESCEILDIKRVPELYISQNPFLNAGAIGVQNPFIVLNSSLIPVLTKEELQAVIAHEIGHCISGHVLYKTLLQLLIRISLQVISLPFSGAVLAVIIAALREWDRKSELTADRAGLLVTQDPNVNYTLLMKMSGGNDVSQISVNEFFIQAAEYEKSDSLKKSMHKLFNTLSLSHPFPVIRLTALKSWVDSGQYQNIIDGNYIRSDEITEEKIGDNFKKAGQSYKEDNANSQDPLSGIMNNAIETAEDIAAKAKEKWDELLKRTK